MSTTYRAMSVIRPGVLEITEKNVPVPGANEVLIAVEACGICGADIGDIEGTGVQPGRVPGHEVVGRIAALGHGVSPRWKLGQRVGAGRLGGHCNECDQCRQGRFQLCRNQDFMGATRDGGYAEMMLVKDTGLVSVPDDLQAEEAAPILCAGIATFNALKKSGAQAGDTMAVLGIGGLGHMALQYARHMGFRVVAVGRGADIAEEALALGAHIYIDTDAEDAASRLIGLGGAQAIISTLSGTEALAKLLQGLAPQGRVILLGAGRDPLPVSTGHLVGGQRSILGSLTGTPYESEKTLDFSVMAGIRPRIQTLPLAQANEAYGKMKSGDVKFRMVLTMRHA
ncbi:alcohol dehydrogenase [Herbaspirillum hiltneri N3]|uniref:Alcohol dehydrogenase n=1 Tax=Herbaspirillum hiltneri N3 TaxID=1262470 RepID=A0ABN4I0S0_9BURK|nr:alcohol dehydrogenase catalytic domain-containing protein [Herbaspirillum hiltneri]AKZ64497.1 alcohol dehydrogenase [Herbaspirillum hiltneri N3]